MFQSCIPDNASTPWLLSKATYLSHMRGIDSLGANEVARDIYDMRPRSEKNCQTLVMFVDNRFQRQVCWHLSCLYFITFRLLALSGYPPFFIASVQKVVDRFRKEVQSLKSTQDECYTFLWAAPTGCRLRQAEGYDQEI